MKLEYIRNPPKSKIIAQLLRRTTYKFINPVPCNTYCLVTRNNIERITIEWLMMPTVATRILIISVMFDQ